MALSKEVSEALKKVPYDIITFWLFSITIATFNFYLRLDYNKELKASLIPYLGCSFGHGYLFLILFIPLLFFSSKATDFKITTLLRSFIILSMLKDVYFGIQDYLQATPEDYTNPNPYLRYDALTPVYTMGVPLFWSLLMLILLAISFLKFKKEKR